jgi:hypothetical protein
MDITKRPVRTTIFFGLFCALLFLAFGLFFEQTVFWRFFFRTSVFCCLSIYALILASWSNQNRISVIFPLIFLVIFNLTPASNATYLLLCLGLLSWIRSGICFQNSLPRLLGTEIILSISGGLLVAYLNPYSSITWALGIWMFFLIQSLYFFLIPAIPTPQANEGSFAEDMFEAARIRAEGILKM